MQPQDNKFILKNGEYLNIDIRAVLRKNFPYNRDFQKFQTFATFKVFQELPV